MRFAKRLLRRHNARRMSAAVCVYSLRNSIRAKIGKEPAGTLEINRKFASSPRHFSVLPTASLVGLSF